ncbi:Triacylglycerol lipase 4 [Cladobotryum mycophilum]|uniref:Patatin-like phospholipase domain-containing protein n=1 Tax=Cladobotryum mycophilum TaxID=491253 RepID=A0ABR0SML0_9HYPO
MADFLLQAPSISSRHINQTRLAQKRKSTSALSQFHANQDQTLLGTVSKTIRGATGLWRSWKDGVSSEEREDIRRLEERKNVLYTRLKNAESLKQWQTAAQELDVLEGNDEWKGDSSSTGDYNPDLIEDRLRELDEARASCDIQSMMHLIRTALSRDLGGMGNVELYKHSYLGTKTLIERYVDSTIQTIDAVIAKSASDQGIAYKDMLEGMLLARQSFGRSALLLSGGGTFGMAHIGVLKTLFEAQLLPRIISGASAGSIVCAVMCTRTDEEIPELIEQFPYGDLAVFDPADKPDSILDHFRRLFTEGSWSDIGNLSRVMREMMGDITFQEAYNRTRRILNICVSTESMYELPKLLNYVTAPNVMIWSAVAASCSVPLVFNGSSLLVKDPATGEHRPWNPTPQRWIDGSVENDLPMTRLAEMFNVNHFIVSQVNPHVAPFLSREDYLSPELRANRNNATQAEDYDWLGTFTSLARDEALHRLHQKYSGDINILPEMTMDNLPVILQNPTVDFMLKCCIVGQRATWPKLSRIRDCCAIELALDRAVHRLRTRVVFSESQSELRNLANAHSGNLRPHVQGLTSYPSAINASYSGQVHKRQRRRSGGSLRTMPGNFMMLEGSITDDDTAEEERLEMASRTRGPPSPGATRKPRLKRASKSSTHVPQHNGMLMSTSHPTAFPNPDFDFSKPLSPPPVRRYNEPEHNDLSELGPTDTELPFLSDAESDHATASQGRMSSPVDDLETSEQGHSSDADVEQATEESDPEPYDSSYSVPASPKPKLAFNDDYSAFGPTGQVFGNMWGI